MSNFSISSRREALERYSNEEFDVVVIGGGITGAGIALDATARGLKTALVEKRDFSAGTSSRSSKLIHGGLRYLEHMEFSLVREGLLERSILSKTAPHLSETFPFLIPIYKDSRRNYDHPIKMRAGLFLYDLLAGRYGFGRHRRLTRTEALEFAPQLDPENLKGAFLYYDAITNDSRLVVEVIKTAHDMGATITNYSRVTGFIKDAGGNNAGVYARDEITGEEFEIRSRVTINATGVWVRDVMNLDSQSQNESNWTVRPSKGIHLTLPADKLKVSATWLIPSLVSHRFYFVVPWEGRVNVGTTDTDYSGDKESPRAVADEMAEILDALRSYFPSARIAPENVISTWAGLRPLISDSENADTTDISRKEEIFESAGGLISISGGKLTTYRKMAEHAVDIAAKRLKEKFNIQLAPVSTGKIPLSGGHYSRNKLNDLVGAVADKEKLPYETARHLVFTYGSNHQTVVEIMNEDNELRQSLVDGLPVIAAEVIYAVRHESALTLADVMTRRTRLAATAGKESLNCAPDVAQLMAGELGWSEQEITRQIGMFRVEFEKEYSIPQVHTG